MEIGNNLKTAVPIPQTTWVFLCERLQFGILIDNHDNCSGAPD